MASPVDWKSLATIENEKQKGKNKGSLFLKIESGNDYTIRPLGKAVQFYKFFVNSIKRSVAVDVDPPNLVNEVAALLSNHFGQEIKPSHRFAMKVIDRSDGKIKILESSSTIFKSMYMWSKATGEAPGSSKAGDWLIGCSGVAPQIKYTASFLKIAPITNVEMQQIEEIKDKPEYDLNKLFAGATLDNVLEKLTGQTTVKQKQSAEPVSTNSDNIDF